MRGTGNPYDLKRSRRDPVTILAPPDPRALHPLGAAPVTEDDGRALVESAAIVESVIVKHGNGRLRLASDHPGYADHLCWFHFATGNLHSVDPRAVPRILAYLQRIGARPAYARAMAEGDPDLMPMLT